MSPSQLKPSPWAYETFWIASHFLPNLYTDLLYAWQVVCLLNSSGHLSQETTHDLADAPLTLPLKFDPNRNWTQSSQLVAYMQLKVTIKLNSTPLPFCVIVMLISCNSFSIHGCFLCVIHLFIQPFCTGLRLKNALLQYFIPHELSFHSVHQQHTRHP